MCYSSHFYCSFCNENFSTHRDFRLHCEDEHIRCSCHQKSFYSRKGLKEHYVQHPDHHYCQYCDAHFLRRDILLDHYEGSHYYCWKCNKIFLNAIGLKEHYVQSSVHLYCQYCDKHYTDKEDFWDHADQSHYPCHTCEKVFPTKERAIAHLKEAHHYCAPCMRFFVSKANLNQHLMSSTHQPRNYICPAPKCNRAFVNTSSLILHAESGTCVGGITRQMVNRYAVRMDRNNVITNPSRLLTGPYGAQAPMEQTFEATERCFNGSAYECYLCHRTFPRIAPLNAHLNSSRHRVKIYRCPEARCKAEYSALSGLFQHIEFGNCGIQRFQPVQDMMNALNQGLKGLAM